MKVRDIMTELKIGDRLIGSEQPSYIIAEAGANHNRDMATAKKLIDAAASAKADAVKFQTYSAETMYSKKTPEFEYLKGNIFDIIKSIELPREWQKELFEYCDEKNITFLSTPFDYRAVDELAAIGVAAFKIASFEIVDLEFVGYAADKGKPMIISTGLCDLGEIEDAVYACEKVGNRDIVLLHCSSNYPSSPDILNLNAIKAMDSAFDCIIGHSDHSLGIHIAPAAVALGAKVIEKHFTLDRNMQGPDHPFAVEPNELEAMVKNIREVEQAMGDGKKRRSAKEEDMYKKARRSIVAGVNIPAGTVITKDMLTVKRPGFGIKPKYKDHVVGRTAKSDIEEDDIITWDMV